MIDRQAFFNLPVNVLVGYAMNIDRTAVVSFDLSIAVPHFRALPHKAFTDPLATRTDSVPQ